jgi:hypothetical protein
MRERTARGQQIAAECEVLCRYLTGRDPTAYVCAQYLAAHDRGGLEPGPEDPFADALLVRMAQLGPRAAAFADAYAAAFARRSTVRKKLILLLAILESGAPTYAWVDSVTTPSRATLLARTAFAAGLFVLRASAAAILIGPLSLAHRLLGSRRRSASSGPS